MWPGFLINHMFFRKRHWHLISKWTFSLVNALNHHWCETSYYLKLFWSITVVSRDFILKNSVCGTSSVSQRNLWHCFISDFFMSFYNSYFQKENLSMWVTSGSHPDCSVGQVSQQVWPLSTLVITYDHTGPRPPTSLYILRYTIWPSGSTKSASPTSS